MKITKRPESRRFPGDYENLRQSQKVYVARMEIQGNGKKDTPQKRW